MTKRILKTHLVIGDAHSTPGVSNRRFDWLANFIEFNRPDVIVNLGDWGSFDSLSHYTRGKKDGWGQSFKKDVAVFRDASKRAFAGIASIKGYSPSIFNIGGNHEEGRITKFLNDHPELDGTVSLDLLGLTDYGATYVPFREVKIIDGVAYSHYFYDKDSRYSLLNSRAVLLKKFHSCVWGDSHKRDFAEGVAADGRKIIALNAGCYLDPLQKMGYAGEQGMNRWWSGLVMLHDVNQGEFDPEFISIARVQREYS